MTISDDMVEKAGRAILMAALEIPEDERLPELTINQLRHLARAALTAALEGSVAVPAWQPIETAPKDREILTVRIEWWEPMNGNNRWINSNLRQTKWDVDRQRFGFGHEKQPTHWTEIPAIPALPIPSLPHQERSTATDRSS